MDGVTDFDRLVILHKSHTLHSNFTPTAIFMCALYRFGWEFCLKQNINTSAKEAFFVELVCVYIKILLCVVGHFVFHCSANMVFVKMLKNRWKMKKKKTERNIAKIILYSIETWKKATLKSRLVGKRIVLSDLWSMSSVIHFFLYKYYSGTF